MLDQVTAVTISGAFVFGLILVLLESVGDIVGKRLGLPDNRVDTLLVALNLALIPGMLFAGALVDAVGPKPVIIAGSLLVTIALAGLAYSETYLRALGAILAVGAGGACLSAASSVLMAGAFFPDFEVASQNRGNVFFALGALVTPTAARRLFDRLGYPRALCLLAVICLLPALLAALTRNSAFDLSGEAESLAWAFRQPVIWLAGIVFLLYGPLEGSIGTWAGRYLHDLGIRESGVGWLLSGFWLTFLAARLLTALVMHQGSRLSAFVEPGLIVLLALAAGVALGNMAGARTRTSGALGLLLVGAFFGPIFPTLVGVLFEHVPAGRHGSAFGVMFAIGATGSLVLPPAIGSYARRSTVQRAMHIPMIMAIGLCILGLVFTLFPLLGQ